MSIVVLYPVLWVVKLALSPGQAPSLSASPLPDAVTFDNFKDVLLASDTQGRWLFGRQLLASLTVSSATTIVGLTLSVSAAWALSRFRFPGREGGMQVLLITQMFPATLMLVPLYGILEKLGLLDSLTGLVLVYSTTSVPFCVWMLKGYFDTLPKELEEAAIVDGASTAQVFFKVVLPLARPALAVTALFSFMQAWNEFILAATLLNDAGRFTLPVALQRFVGEYKVEWGRFAAGALVVSAPVMALFFALQKHLVGGLTAGGVKG
ncbi:MAG: sugar ABC transporter permease [Myxococcaceae bacterium]|nr:sugar ABC transporter permease [Myxococcaceae bacterium]